MRGKRVVLLIAVLILPSMAMLSGTSGARGNGTTSAVNEPLFTAEGVESTVLALSETEDTDHQVSYLLLEKLSLPAGTDLPNHRSGSSELTLVEDGTVSFRDAYGFSSTVSRGEQTAISPDSEYMLANDSTEPATLLRLRLATGEEEVLAGTSASAPTSNEAPSTELLIDQEVAPLSVGATTLFIARATFQPGSKVSEQVHAGPLGLYVETGTLRLRDRSGVMSELASGTDSFLATSSPFAGGNDGNTEAVLLLVGAVATGPQLFTTATGVPTATDAPTEMPRPTATVAPTRTPVAEPTAPISPTTRSDNVPLTAWLPAQNEVPDQLVITNDQVRSLDDVAQNYADPTATVNLFRSWGWQGNVTRSFAPPGGTLTDSTQVGGIYVSVHAFDSVDSAAAALDYSLANQAEGTTLFEIDAPAFGDYCRGLYGVVDYDGRGTFFQNELTYLVQIGNVFLRLTIASPDGDPTQVANQVMEAMLSVESWTGPIIRD